MSSLRGLVETLALLGIGLGCLWFAWAGPYERLMNPAFRGVTIAGGLLVTLMGAVLYVRPRPRAGPGAALVFAALFAVVLLGRPFAAGVSPLLEAAQQRPATVEREGYPPLEPRDLFSTLDAEVDDVAEGTYVLAGLVHRTEALDAQGVFVLLDPLIACCLADALALGVRVRSDALPDAGTWQYVYGALRILDAPVVTPRFRVGAIVFSNVSRVHEVVADDIVSFQSLLEDVYEKIPEDHCGRFRESLEASGLGDRLRSGKGPLTVFAPLDLGLDDGAASIDPRDFVVEGRLTKESLFGVDTLEALSGRMLSVEVRNGRVLVEGARILFADSRGRNGLVHIVHPAWRKR